MAECWKNVFFDSVMKLIKLNSKNSLKSIFVIYLYKYIVSYIFISFLLVFYTSFLLAYFIFS